MTAPVEDWQVVALEVRRGAAFLHRALGCRRRCYFAIFQYVTGQPPRRALGSFVGSYVMLLLDGHVLPVAGLPGLGRSRATRSSPRSSRWCSWCSCFSRAVIGFVAAGNASQAFRDFVAYFSSFEHMRELLARPHRHPADRLLPEMTVLLQFLTFHIFQYRKWKA